MSKKNHTIFIHLLICLALCTLGLTACSPQSSTSSANESTTATASALKDQQHTPEANTTARTSETSTVSKHPVKVYFSKTDSAINSNQVYPVYRMAPNQKVANFAIQQLIAGPTAAEQREGYISQVQKMINGPSVCPGNVDFTLDIDKKGDLFENGTATLKFCRSISNGTDALSQNAAIRNEINSTLTQFSTIKKVIILQNDGHCFADLSGADVCLK